MIRVNGTHPINIEIEDCSFTVYSFGKNTVLNFQLDSKEAEILMKRLHSQLKQIENDIQRRWKYVDRSVIPAKVDLTKKNLVTLSPAQKLGDSPPKEAGKTLREELELPPEGPNGMISGDEDPFNGIY